MGQLLHLAGAGRTVRPGPGALVYRESAAASRVQLLLEGPVAVQAGDAPAAECWAPSALGLEAVLGGERHRETVWAGEGAVCVTVEARDLLGLLAEDVGLVSCIFQALLEGSAADSRALPSRRPVEAPGLARAQTLEAVHVLEASPLFARAAPDQVLRLAQIDREVPLAPGSALFDEADPAALYLVASGAASVPGLGLHERWTST